MTKDEIIRLARDVGLGTERWTTEEEFYDFLERFAWIITAHERETHRLPKMTEDQIWKCNNDGDGGVHICVEHQNVVDFARAIEREIGFDRANLWVNRIKAAIETEREACAKVCDDRADGALHAAEFAGRNAVVAAEEATECAAAIRARGK